MYIKLKDFFKFIQMTIGLKFTETMFISGYIKSGSIILQHSNVLKLNCERKRRKSNNNKLIVKYDRSLLFYFRYYISLSTFRFVIELLTSQMMDDIHRFIVTCVPYCLY